MSSPSSPRSSCPSLVDSDVVQRTKIEIDEKDLQTLTKEIKEAMEERKSQHPGLYTEMPEHYDPYGTAPAYKKKLTDEEKAQEERIMKEWKAKPERPPQHRPNPGGHFTTESAMEDDLLDEIDKMFKPTLASSYAPEAIRVKVPVDIKETAQEEKESNNAYDLEQEFPTDEKNPHREHFKKDHRLDESRRRP